ncbi:Hypothetical predicted protein [Pelobates cultripes]|uniref:Uncharacterized protein n=1 Tax=Pelobates cultripes TaxID=61616 RepID=A0AAD1T435_PELCU|nr:Hypothetical predicted protein [Pelobates cultripes]
METPKMAYIPGLITRGLKLPRLEPAEPSTGRTVTLEAIIGRLWAMLSSNTGQIKATQEPNTKPRVSTKKRPRGLPEERKRSRTHLTAAKRRKLWRQCYQRRRRAADGHLAQSCQGVPCTNTRKPVICRTTKPLQGQHLCHLQLDISSPSDDTSPWQATTILDNFIYPVCIG